MRRNDVGRRGTTQLPSSVCSRVAATMHVLHAVRCARSSGQQHISGRSLVIIDTLEAGVAAPTNTAASMTSSRVALCVFVLSALLVLLSFAPLSAARPRHLRPFEHRAAATAHCSPQRRHASCEPRGGLPAADHLLAAGGRAPRRLRTAHTRRDADGLPAAAAATAARWPLRVRGRRRHRPRVVLSVDARVAPGLSVAQQPLCAASEVLEQHWR